MIILVTTNCIADTRASQPAATGHAEHCSRRVGGELKENVNQALGNHWLIIKAIRDRVICLQKAQAAKTRMRAVLQEKHKMT